MAYYVLNHDTRNYVQELKARFFITVIILEKELGTRGSRKNVYQSRSVDVELAKGSSTSTHKLKVEILHKHK